MSWLRDRGEKGASLVETSLVMPLLLMLAIGGAEVGFMVIDYMTISNAAREGARTGAAAADYVGPGGVDADDLIVEAVEQVACNLRYSTLERVAIYKADENGNPIDPTNLLNEYTGSVDCSTGSTGLSCANGCPWAPASRYRGMPEPDKVGVEVVFRHEPVVGFLPFPTVTFRESAVMRLEPDTRG